jgi:hypothetical protein
MLRLQHNVILLHLHVHGFCNTGSRISETVFIFKIRMPYYIRAIT